MYCIKCGTQNDNDAKFCIKCGSDLKNKIIKKNIEAIQKFKIGIVQRFKIRMTGFRCKINFEKENVKMITVIFGLLIILSIMIILSYGIRNGNQHGNGGLINDFDAVSGEYVEKLMAEEIVNVSISSVPSGANIYIDDIFGYDIFKGKTPAIVGLSEGNYELRINLTGYIPIKVDFNVASDTIREEIDVILEPDQHVKNSSIYR